MNFMKKYRVRLFLWPLGFKVWRTEEKCKQRQKSRKSSSKVVLLLAKFIWTKSSSLKANRRFVFSLFLFSCAKKFSVLHWLLKTESSLSFRFLHLFQLKATERWAFEHLPFQGGRRFITRPFLLCRRKQQRPFWFRRPLVSTATTTVWSK